MTLMGDRPDAVRDESEVELDELALVLDPWHEQQEPELEAEADRAFVVNNEPTERASAPASPRGKGVLAPPQARLDAGAARQEQSRGRSPPRPREGPRQKRRQRTELARAQTGQQPERVIAQSLAEDGATAEDGGSPQTAEDNEEVGRSSEDGSGSAARTTTGPKRQFPRTPARRRKNREACVNYRLRKRKEMDTLRTRNDELELERQIYQARIADLQTEVDALRYGGDMDFAKENELLRVEIRRHKAFIQHIVGETRRFAPADVSPEKQLRILHNGLQSTRGQVLGLAYASASDPSWEVSATTQLGTAPYRISYQYLPVGLDRSKDLPKRVNVRTDTTLHVPFDVAKRTIKRMRTDLRARIRKENIKAKHAGVDLQIRDVLPDSIKRLMQFLGEDESLQAIHQVETRTLEDGSRVSKDLTVATAGGMADVCLSAIFGERGFAQVPAGHMAKAYVACSSNLHGAFEKAQIGPRAEDAVASPASPLSTAGSPASPGAPSTASQARSSSTFIFGGTILTPHPFDPTVCYWTVINSMPIGHEESGTFDPHLPHLFDERGELEPNTRQSLTELHANLYYEIAADEAAGAMAAEAASANLDLLFPSGY